MNIGDEIKRMLSEAIETAAQRCLDEAAMAMEPLTIYSSPGTSHHTGWGELDPETNVVEGSITEPITDEGRLLP